MSEIYTRGRCSAFRVAAQLCGCCCCCCLRAGLPAFQENSDVDGGIRWHKCSVDVGVMRRPIMTQLRSSLGTGHGHQPRNIGGMGQTSGRMTSRCWRGSPEDPRWSNCAATSSSDGGSLAVDDHLGAIDAEDGPSHQDVCARFPAVQVTVPVDVSGVVCEHVRNAILVLGWKGVSGHVTIIQERLILAVSRLRRAQVCSGRLRAGTRSACEPAGGS